MVPPDIKVCALLTALDYINNIVKFVSGSFVFRMNQFLFQSVTGSEVNWDLMLKLMFKLVKVHC